MGRLGELLHLCAWAQLGVLTRVYLGKLFGGACALTGSGTGDLPCVTSPGLTQLGGALFIDLPSNVVGSFVMGLLSPGDLLAMVYPGTASSAKGIPLPLLPRNNPLQKHSSLLLGLRTGYCGSLTTFASWMLQMVRMMIGGAPAPVIGSEWVEGLWGIGIGTAAALAALVAGQHVALMAWHGWNNLVSSPKQCVGNGNEAQDKQADAAKANGAGSVVAVHGDVQIKVVGGSVGGGGGVNGAPAPAAAAAPSKPLLAWAGDGVAVVILLVLTGISLGFAVHDTREETMTSGHQLRAYIWFSILLGPFGCLTRWKLGVFNGKVKGSWSWFPAGTYAANVLACMLDFFVASLLLRLTSLSNLQRAILMGIIAGIGGCLSTVSTWVVEIQKLHVALPHNMRGYVYMATSLVSAIILGIIIYGTSVWTM